MSQVLADLRHFQAFDTIVFVAHRRMERDRSRMRQTVLLLFCWEANSLCEWSQWAEGWQSSFSATLLGGAADEKGKANPGSEGTHNIVGGSMLGPCARMPYSSPGIRSVAATNWHGEIWVQQGLSRSELLNERECPSMKSGNYFGGHLCAGKF